MVAIVTRTNVAMTVFTWSYVSKSVVHFLMTYTLVEVLDIVLLNTLFSLHIADNYSGICKW